MKNLYNQRVVSKTPAGTKKIAEKLAGVILSKHKTKYATVIGLIGELGSGKTTFAKGFAKGLGIKQIIQSPTFIIARQHSLEHKIFKNFYHIDAYRVGQKDLVALGWQEWINNPNDIILVEWADRIYKILPKNSIKIYFETLKNGQRKISLQ